jgi:hypothetical protein
VIYGEIVQLENNAGMSPNHIHALYRNSGKLIMFVRVRRRVLYALIAALLCTAVIDLWGRNMSCVYDIWNLGFGSKNGQLLLLYGPLASSKSSLTLSVTNYSGNEVIILMPFKVCYFIFALLVVLVVTWPNAPLANNSCIKCRYDLTGNSTGKCPECGSVIPSQQRRLLTARPVGDK